jgi:hypothetical protein
VACCAARAQGGAPKFKETLKTFFPEGRATTVPVNAHPDEEMAVKAPVDETISEMSSPVVAVRNQFPETDESKAGVL